MNEICESYCALMMILFTHRTKRDIEPPAERELVGRIRSLWATMNHDERREVLTVFEPVVSEYEISTGAAWIRCPACRKPFTADVGSPVTWPPKDSEPTRCPACSTMLLFSPHVMPEH